MFWRTQPICPESVPPATSGQRTLNITPFKTLKLLLESYHRHYGRSVEINAIFKLVKKIVWPSGKYPVSVLFKPNVAEGRSFEDDFNNVRDI